MAHRLSSTKRTTIACIALAAGVATSVAQETPNADAAQRPQPLLSGPKVEDRRLPGVESGFTLERGEAARMGGQPFQPRMFRETIASLMAEDAPAEIRLSPEQRERIATHVRAYEQRAGTPDAGPRRGFAPRPNREGRRAAPDGERRVRPPVERDGPGADRPATMGPEDRPQPGRMNQLRDRASMMRAMADLQHKVWAELTAAQQTHVGERLEAHRARTQAQRERQMRERYRKKIAERFAEADERRMEGGPAFEPPAELDGLLSDLPGPARARVMRRFESLTPPQREAALERLRSMSAEDRARLGRRALEGERRGPGERNPR